MSKLYIITDEDGIIKGVAQEAFDGHHETDIEFERFMEDYKDVNLTDGKHKYFDGGFIEVEPTELSHALFVKERKKEIRRNREMLCFPVVNRGEVWYDKLTAEQSTELLEWYNAWLIATETLIEPETPIWLN